MVTSIQTLPGHSSHVWRDTYLCPWRMWPFPTSAEETETCDQKAKSYKGSLWYTPDQREGINRLTRDSRLLWPCWINELTLSRKYRDSVYEVWTNKHSETWWVGIEVEQADRLGAEATTTASPSLTYTRDMGQQKQNWGRGIRLGVSGEEGRHTAVVMSQEGGLPLLTAQFPIPVPVRCLWTFPPFSWMYQSPVIKPLIYLS